MTPIMYTITKSKYSMLTTSIEQNLKYGFTNLIISITRN